MRQRRYLTVVAAGATLLAALPVTTLFHHLTWAVRAVLVVAAMCAVTLVVRSVRTPRWAPTTAMALTALLALTWLFPSGREYAGVIPSPATFAHFADLLRAAGAETARFAAPVGDRDGLLFVAALGVAAVALLVDALAVVLHRPALAGLPMLAVYSVPVAVTSGSTDWLPFVLGAAGFLWLLGADNVDRVRNFGRRFGGDGRDAGPWAASPLTAAGHRLGAVGVSLAILVPLVPIAMPGGAIEWLGKWGSAGGRPVNMLAEFAGRLEQDAVFDMVTVTGATDPDPHYLRLNTLDVLTDRGFSDRPAGAGVPVRDGLAAPPWDAAATGTVHRAEIEVAAGLDGTFLPIYLWPTGIDGLAGTWTFDARAGVVHSSERSTARQRYTLTYVRPQLTPDDLRGAAPVDPRDPALKDALAVPRNPAVASTVEQLVRGRATQYDKVAAIQGFFAANGFVYDTGAGTDTDIDGFLRNRRGYCVQFAAAFGWLLREAGIPSRVAIGFARGTTRGGTTTLTNHDLHAWTEVYFTGFGWLPFDATPPTAITGSATTSYAPGTGNAAGQDDAGRGGPAPVPSGGAGGPSGGPASVQPGPADPGRPGTGGASTVGALLRGAGPWALGGTLILLLLLTPAAARGRIRRNRLAWASAGPPDDAAARSRAHHAWDELIDTMLDFRLPCQDSDTPRATVERLAVEGHLGARARAGVRLLTEVEEHARYARRPLAARELRAALGEVRADLAGHTTAATRLRAVLLPPSVLRRWRARAAVPRAPGMPG